MSCGQPYKLKHNTSVYRSQAHDKIEHCEHIVIGGRDSIPTDGQHLGVALLLTPQANSLICAKITMYEGHSGSSGISSIRRILPHSGNMVVLSHITYV